jgi:RNA polymerase sigma factor (sigma-70 family)
MTEPVLTPIAKHLRRLATPAAEPDSALLRRFLAEHDQAAFAEVVARHGPMVLAACRRILGHHQDAEDAAQATFLVLAKKAGAVTWQPSVAGWLHAVAFRLAQKVRSRRGRRRTADGVSDMSAPPANTEADWDRVQAVIDEEIRRLPAEYSAVVLLCGVEGVSTATAAERLNLSDGAVRGRLYRGRELLRERLAARGVTVSSAALVTFLAQTGSAAPAVAWDAVAAAAAAYAVGQPVAGGLSAAVPELARRTLTAMFLTRTAPMALVAFLALAATTGAVLVSRQTADAAPQPPKAAPVANLQPDEKKADPQKEELEEVEATVKKVEADKGVLVCEVRDDQGMNEFRFTATSDAKFHFHERPIALADAKPGMHAKMKVLRKTGLDIQEARLNWPRFRAEVKAADAAKSSISVEIEGQDDQKFTMPFDVSKDANLLIDGIPAGVDDLAGAKAELHWSLDKKSFVGVTADGGANDFGGWVKAVDAAGNTITVTTEVESDRVSRKVSLNLPVANDARIRLLGKEAKLSVLKEGMPVRVKLAADLRTVAGVWADAVPPAKPKDKDDD